MKTPKGVIRDYIFEFQSIQNYLLLKDNGNNTKEILRLYMLLDEAINEWQNSPWFSKVIVTHCKIIEELEKCGYLPPFGY